MRTSQILASISAFFACCVFIVEGAAVVANARHHDVVRPNKNWRPYFIAHACERSVLRLACPANRVLSITRARYGRERMTICVEGNISTQGWSTDCVASHRRTIGVTNLLCNGQHECQVPVINEFFGDPCPQTYKYLEVYYSCLPGAQDSETDFLVDEHHRHA